MNLIDSHTHIYFEEEFPDAIEVVQRAIDAGVTHLVLPGVNVSTIAPMHRLHAHYPHNTSMAIGLHPCDALPSSWKEELEQIGEELFKHPNDYVAIGETGMDLYWDKTHVDIQQQSLECQLGWGVQLNKPIILHCREAFDATIEVLSGVEKRPPVVFHSYSGDVEQTERLLALFPDAYFGINGIVTFKNARLKDVLTLIPLNQMMLETDAPYLAPVPHRGKRNESAFLVNTALFVANHLGKSAEELADITTDNAKRFFSL